MSRHPFEGLGKYSLIMADPPWTFKTFSDKGIAKSAEAQYRCMSLADIMALPVADIAEKDCVLLLWATNPLLREAFMVVDSWGFTYKTAAHWSKKTKHGKQAFGTGYLVRCAGEPLLVATRGKPQTTRACRSVIEGPVREHSRKPDEAFAWAEALMPAARRVELFSRQQRSGWDTWGNETMKFAA